ncbi:MAG: hypothetical protein GAK41_01498 [Burkholderia gladioli]|nr:MAG: hypothetical protein GAK41_01498 [Burkholderia gladioli]
MRTPGTTPLRFPPRRMHGFTLLEMMVVLVIVGILVTAATLTMRRNPRTDLHEEAVRISLLLESDLAPDLRTPI